MLNRGPVIIPNASRTPPPHALSLVRFASVVGYAGLGQALCKLGLKKGRFPQSLAILSWDAVSCGPFGPLGAILWPSSGHLGIILGRLGLSWGHPGAISGPARVPSGRLGLSWG